MSYWIYLRNQDGSTVDVSNHSEGGTYVLGGTTIAELNVTYNYGKHIHKYMVGGLRWLDGKRAGDTVEVLTKAVNDLGTQRDSDYWASTPGNAGYALSILLIWAVLNQDAYWEVS